MMNSNELAKTMKDKGFTDEGVSSCINIRENFPLLYKYYDEYMGNIVIPSREMTKEIWEEVMNIILQKNPNDDPYVLFRTMTSDENGIVNVPSHVITKASYVG